MLAFVAFVALAAPPRAAGQQAPTAPALLDRLAVGIAPFGQSSVTIGQELSPLTLSDESPAVFWAAADYADPASFFPDPPIRAMLQVGFFRSDLSFAEELDLPAAAGRAGAGSGGPTGQSSTGSGGLSAHGGAAPGGPTGHGGDAPAGAQPPPSNASRRSGEPQAAAFYYLGSPGDRAHSRLFAVDLSIAAGAGDADIGFSAAMSRLTGSLDARPTDLRIGYDFGATGERRNIGMAAWRAGGTIALLLMASSPVTGAIDDEQVVLIDRSLWNEYVRLVAAANGGT